MYGRSAKNQGTGLNVGKIREESGKWLSVRNIREETGKRDQYREDQGRIR